jgi:hypothetical protein
MHYDTLQDLQPPLFKRLTGVQKDTFALMLDVLTERTRMFGRPRKLSLADQLLLTLCYWREYRTLFHTAQDYGVSEATACRIVHKVENVLIKSERFHLPGKKALRPTDTLFEVVVIDATECPVERPKKNRDATIAARRSGIPRKRR